MLNLRNILQHGLDLNANVKYEVSITVKTMLLSNQLKIFSYFNVNLLLRKCVIIIIIVNITIIVIIIIII